ncbi:MAG: cytochrome c oxidase accessory protein CcoG [Rhizobacter sp.]|nr:cytochrome c oxidase accessory protein CcoG [Bacteriovorax sp.]
MTTNRFELDQERIATTDEQGHRVYLYPEDVKGVWKDRRTVVYWFLIGVYLIMPWIYVNHKPSLMIDIFKREFTFMGSTFYGVEPILFFLIVAFLLFFIAFMTSLFGRVWCGWACPQTVFIQALFLKIETFIEGSARERRAQEKSPKTTRMYLKKFLKWIIFTIISLHIAHTLVGYFTGPRELFYITMHSPAEHFGIFTATMIITSIFLLDFGWFREQFCIIACPYGRMQSVMMDENSSIIMYDVKRGEPRRGSVNATNTGEGDCINCYNCVKVCPTGIDIRRGTQLECIACTNCIDACDEIMIKIKKPKGLIRFGSENEVNGLKRNLFTGRSMVYATISLVFIGAFIFFLNDSSKLDLIFIRGTDTYSLSDNEITNRFALKITHQGDRTYKVKFNLKDQSLNSKIKIITPQSPLELSQHEKKIIIFFKFEKSLLESGSKKIDIDVYDEVQNKIVTTKEVVLVGPTN